MRSRTSTRRTRGRCCRVGKIARHGGSNRAITVRDFAHAVEPMRMRVRTAWATRPQLCAVVQGHVGPRCPPYGAEFATKATAGETPAVPGKPALHKKTEPRFQGPAKLQPQ